MNPHLDTITCYTLPITRPSKADFVVYVRIYYLKVHYKLIKEIMDLVDRWNNKITCSKRWLIIDKRWCILVINIT